MSHTSPLDSLPLWFLLGCTTAAVLLFIEAGFRLGKYRCKVSEAEASTPVGTIVGSTLGLLAFMLAFSFSLAASRFDARRQTVVEEANSIGTTYLRAGLLPQPQATQIRKLLSEYIESRLDVANSGKRRKLSAKRTLTQSLLACSLNLLMRPLMFTPNAFLWVSGAACPWRYGSLFFSSPHFR
jgi:hypothetical protein